MKSYISNRIKSSVEESFDLVKSELLVAEVTSAFDRLIKPFPDGEVYTSDDDSTLVCYAENGVFVITKPFGEDNEWWDEVPDPEEVPGYVWKNPVTGIEGQDLAVKLSRLIESGIEPVYSEATFKDMDRLLSGKGFTLVETHDENNIVYLGD